MDGASEAIGASEATSIAEWLDTEADGEWGADPRHHDIAVDIRAAISRAEEYVAFESDRESEWAAYEASIADAILCDAYRADRDAGTA